MQSDAPLIRICPTSFHRAELRGPAAHTQHTRNGVKKKASFSSGTDRLLAAGGETAAASSQLHQTPQPCPPPSLQKTPLTDLRMYQTAGMPGKRGAAFGTMWARGAAFVIWTSSHSTNPLCAIPHQAWYQYMPLWSGWWRVDTLYVALLLGVCSLSAATPREVLDLNKNWRFQRTLTSPAQDSAECAVEECSVSTYSTPDATDRGVLCVMACGCRWSA